MIRDGVVEVVDDDVADGEEEETEEEESPFRSWSRKISLSK